MDADAFALSFLAQPDLFLRIRPGYETVVKENWREQIFLIESSMGVAWLCPI